MTNQEMIAKLQDLQELKRMAEEINTAIEATKDELKAAMGDTEEATFGPFKVTYKTVISTRLDTAKVRNAFAPEALAPFMTTTKTRPFKVT